MRLVEFEPVELLARDQVAVAAIGDLHLLQHLAHDHLDMLVVDGHTLQAIDFLDLVDEIGGEFLDALDGQDIMRRRVPIDDEVAHLDHVAILKVNMLALRDQIFNRLRFIMRGSA